MNAPWWREQTQHWYIKLHGKQVRLSEEKDPDGATRKHPPTTVMDAWHRIMEKGQPLDMKLKDVFDLFREVCRDEPKSSTKWCLDQFEAYVGSDIKVLALRPFHLTEFFKRNPQWSGSSVRTITSRVLAALNYAVREGMIDRNPISSTPGYKRHGQHQARKGVVPPELAEKLEAAAIPALRSILVALRETGCRPSELRRAKIERCFLAEGMLYVPNKTARKTGKQERTIYLSDRAKELIAALIGTRTEGFIFLTKNGKPWTYSNLEERWRYLTKKVEVPDHVTLYTYRRSFISSAINEKNVNPALVAQLIGHVGLDVLLKHYLEEDPTALKRAMEKITEKKR